MTDTVTVTLSNPLSADDAYELGLPLTSLETGTPVIVSSDSATRLITAGLTTINPTDSVTIDALLSGA